MMRCCFALSLDAICQENEVEYFSSLLSLLQTITSDNIIEKNEALARYF
jgi:hypothetical protein